MGIAKILSERIAATRYEDLPPEAIYWCKVAVMDTVGVALAGSREPALIILREVLQPVSGPSLVFGTNQRASCLDAAHINGTAAHALDFDNTAAHFAGHISAVMVPALLAAGEAFNSSGRDLLLAHALGYEAGCRIGRGVNVDLYHSEKGWHPTSTLGVFAVAAACARLLGLNAVQTETALAIATSLAAGIKANFGTMTKPLHVGECARGGLMAVLLARQGFTANAEAFEHKQGFFNLFNGPGNFDPALVNASWGQPFDVVSPGASYKQYPCCYSTHAAIEAALTLVREHGVFDPAAIAKVETWTPAFGLSYTNRPDPQSDLDAKFSVQYCAVKALLSGKVVLEDFENHAYRDAVMQSVLPRVRSEKYTGKMFDPADPFDAELKLTLTDGRMLFAKVDRPLGRTSEIPIPYERLKAKFENCAGRVLSAGAVAKTLQLIDSIEEIMSARELTQALQPTPEAQSPRKVA
jgi:2-methylcitrate dehydratase PrpD